MPARVFISYRSSDGTDKATALARDLDELFGQEQIFLDKEDLAAGSHWRDEIARTLDASPILLVLVTPGYLGALDGQGGRCIDRADDPVKSELEAALAADAHVVPLLCDGVTQTPLAATLPAPFGQLPERTWRRLRAYDWREDLARLAEDLRGMGVVPRHAQPEAEALPSAQPSGRRTLLAAVAALFFAGVGIAAWRMQAQRPASLAGRWRASVGRRGATTSRDGEVVILTIEQTGQSLRVASSAFEIERDADWQQHRDLWKQRTGEALNRVFYRGEGVIRSDGADTTPADAPPGPRRVLLSMRVDVPGGGEPIDSGALRGAIDPDGQRIRGRLWLNGEQGERVVDLRREP